MSENAPPPTGQPATTPAANAGSAGRPEEKDGKAVPSALPSHGIGPFLKRIGLFLERHYVRLKAGAGNPLYVVLITFAGFFTGFFGSLYNAQIRTAFPFVWPTAGHSTVNGYAVSFWFLALLWLALFWLKQKVDSENTGKQKAATQELLQDTAKIQNQSALIQETIVTMPPAPFLRQFGQQVTAMYAVLLSSLPRTTRTGMSKDQLGSLIRRLLQEIASLACFYDARQARYIANVMLFVPRQNDVPPYFPKLPEDIVRRFLPKYYGLEFLEGVLVLPKGLSPVSEREGDPNAQPMATIEEVVFGIPRDYREGTEWTVLPGAPMAFSKWRDEAKASNTASLREAVQGLDDVRQFGTLVKEHEGEGEDFTIQADVVAAIQNYYETIKVRSFQAFPLVKGDGTREAFGALNVYCEQPVFLGPGAPQEAHKRQQMFADLMSPVVFELANSVQMWWDLSKDEYCD